jgi:hypothetical protein
MKDRYVVMRTTHIKKIDDAEWGKQTLDFKEWCETLGIPSTKIPKEAFEFFMRLRLNATPDHKKVELFNLTQEDYDEYFLTEYTKNKF